MDALVFDMDGVVVDSEDYWHRAEREALLPRVLDGEGPGLDEITGMPYREIYDYLDENYETQISKAEFVDLYDDTAAGIYRERVALLDCFAEIRESTRDAGVPVALVSSSPTTWMEYVLDRFDLEFDLTLSNDGVDGPGKPEADIYDAATDRLGVDPGDCVAVEDSRNGTLAAERAGMTVVGYRVEHNAETDLSACDVVCDGSEELRGELLGRVEQ
ncbi:MAG: HAD family hydrolase [Halolamina sp.]